MPVDPSISLNVTGGRTGLSDPGYAQSSNPLALAGNLADTQNKFNTNRLFQQTMAARQKLGQIMASSPDIDTAIQRAQEDPSVAGFVPDLLQTLASANSIKQETLTKEYSRTADAFTRAAGLLQGGLTDPNSLERNLPSFLSQIPDQATRDHVEVAIGPMIKGLTDGLPDDPEAAKKEYTKRLLAAGFQTGSQDALTKQLPQPNIINRGDVLQPGTQAGAVPTILSQPGAVSSTGNPLSLGVAPQVANPGGVLTGGKYGTGGSGGGAQSVAPPGRSPAAGSVISGLGTPLFDASTVMKPPTPIQRDLAGNPTGLEGGRAKQLAEAHSGLDLDRFKSAQDTEAQLADVSHDIESLARNGGFLSPGAGGEARMQLAKFGKMIEDVTGSKLDIDVNKIANAEDLMKATNRMTLDFLNSKLGNQREAAETIRNMTDKGMPGINNTLLGSRLMIGMIGALNQRTKDSWKWDDEWASRNNGDLRGSAAAFDSQYNARKYIDKALADLGMNEHGFTSRAALQKALDDGLLTPAQADVIRKNKGRIPDDLPKAD